MSTESRQAFAHYREDQNLKWNTDEDAWRVKMLNACLAGKTIDEVDFELCDANHDMFFAYPLDRLDDLVPLLTKWAGEGRDIGNIIAVIIFRGATALRGFLEAR
jgi:hypothetical protein